jgi:mono/diheme cytochrome c family protein
LVRLLVVALVLGAVAATHASRPTSAARAQDPVARGKYLVEGVAMCADCHTPRGAGGELDREQWMAGATLDFKPAGPNPVWADYAPPLAGWGGRGSSYSEEQAIKLLETGLGPNGKPLRPPMPAYRMSREDATAVVAYLKTVKRVRPK